jgi:DNA invertase Pin-like site-specific DNA recombinase
MIQERVNAGLARARENGVKLGRPVNVIKLLHALRSDGTC